MRGELRRRGVGLPPPRARHAGGGGAADSAPRDAGRSARLVARLVGLCAPAFGHGLPPAGVRGRRPGHPTVPAASGAVVGPGESLPGLPGFAGRVARPWRPPARSIPIGATPCAHWPIITSEGGNSRSRSDCSSGLFCASRWMSTTTSCWPKRFLARQTAGRSLGGNPAGRRAASRLQSGVVRPASVGRRRGCRELAVHTARKLTQSRSGEPRSWLCSGKCSMCPKRKQRLAALETAFSLNPAPCRSALAASDRWPRVAAGTKLGRPAGRRPSATSRRSNCGRAPLGSRLDWATSRRPSA